MNSIDSSVWKWLTPKVIGPWAFIALMIVVAISGNWPTDDNGQPMKFNKWRGFHSGPPPSTSPNDFFKQDSSPASKRKAHTVFLGGAKSALESGDNEKAIELATTAIKILPEDDEAYQCRGFAHQELGDIDLAVDDFTTATKLNPDSGRAQVLLCMLLLRVDFDQARIELAKAENMDLEPELRESLNLVRKTLVENEK